MISLIETLNHWSAGMPGLAWQMFWQSSLLIAAVFALDLALRRKARAAVRYALWLVVLLKLVIPPTLAAPTSVAWWVRSPQPTPPITQAKHYVVSYPNSQRTEPPVDLISVFTGGAMQHSPVLSWAGWALLASGAFSIGLLTWAIFRWQHVARIVRDASPANESLTRLLNEAGRGIGVRRSVQLLLTNQPMSPAVCGLSRPVVLLPRSLAEQLPPNRLRAVLLHELTHLKRGDVWVNCLQTLLQIVYWWHPLVWLANARIRRVREEAVDDAVMLALRDDADCYAPTLLDVAKLAFHRPLASLGLVGILESRSALRQRVERLVEFSAPRSAGLSLVPILGIAAFTALAVPMGEAPTHSKEIAQLGSRVPQVVVTNNAWAHANGFDWHLGNVIMASPVSTNEPQFVFVTEADLSTVDKNVTLVSRRFNLDMGKLLTTLHLPTNSVGDNDWSRDFQSRFLDYFKSRGVDLGKPPKSLFFHADGRIWIHSTAEDLALMEVIIGTNSLSKSIASAVPQGESPQKTEAVILIQDGKLLFELGKLEEAKAKLKRALELDPQNLASPYYLALVQQAQFREAHQKLFGPSGNASGQTNSPRLIYTSEARRIIMKKLDQIRLDNVSYDSMPLSEVVRNLSEKTKQRDPDGHGINFLIRAMPTAQAVTIDPGIGLPTPPTSAPPNAIADINSVSIKINPPLSNARVVDLLDAIVKSADKPIKYGIQDYAVVFSLKPPNESPPLLIRKFIVDPNIFFQNMEKVTGFAFASAPHATKIPSVEVQGESRAPAVSNFIQSAVISFFQSIGVNLDPPKSVFFNDREGSLWIRATAQDLDTIEGAIPTLSVAPPQVNIRVKFIELDENIANALSLLWNQTNRLNPLPRAGAPTAILTVPAMKELMSALRKRPGVTELSDASVTTLSGRQTQIQMVQITNVVSGITNGTYQTIKTVLGPVLDVVPYVSADGYTIQMTISPSFTEFLGYDDPLKVLPNGMKSPLPHFRVREMATSAIVWDGQTVVLSRLPQTDVVTSNGTTSTNATAEDPKRNLFVLITPTLIDRAGNRIHTDDEINSLPTAPR